MTAESPEPQGTLAHKRVACLHVHHGNIPYLDEALASLGAVGVHYVDPGLLARITGDATFSDADGRTRAADQLVWMAAAGADALVVTCTAYAALVEADLQIGVPVLVIDEPLFEQICSADAPRRLFFTNPATVEPTMARLNEFAAARGVTTEFEAELIPDAFELFVSGRPAEHDDLLADRLASHAGAGTAGSSFAMQLSMTAAARRVGGIANPLDSLTRALRRSLGDEPLGEYLGD